MSYANLLRETRPATADAVGPLRRSLAEYVRAGGFDEERLELVLTAFSEAVGNVIAHAYPDGPGEIEASAFFTSTELWIKVADHGIGCNEPSGRRGLGLGLGLIAEACDSFTLEERRSGGTLATMRFRLDAEPVSD